jgi:hypothetical protein
VHHLRLALSVLPIEVQAAAEAQAEPLWAVPSSVLCLDGPWLIWLQFDLYTTVQSSSDGLAQREIDGEAGIEGKATRANVDEADLGLRIPPMNWGTTGPWNRPVANWSQQSSFEMKELLTVQPRHVDGMMDGGQDSWAGSLQLFKLGDRDSLASGTEHRSPSPLSFIGGTRCHYPAARSSEVFAAKGEHRKSRWFW